MRDVSMQSGTPRTIDDDGLVDINDGHNIPKVIVFNPSLLKSWDACLIKQVDSQDLEQTSMGHHSLEPLQGSMETFDPRENWTHFGQQLVMVRSLTPSRSRTLKLEV